MILALSPRHKMAEWGKILGTDKVPRDLDPGSTRGPRETLEMSQGTSRHARWHHRRDKEGEECQGNNYRDVHKLGQAGGAYKFRYFSHRFRGIKQPGPALSSA